MTEHRVARAMDNGGKDVLESKELNQGATTRKREWGRWEKGSGGEGLFLSRSGSVPFTSQ